MKRWVISLGRIVTSVALIGAITLVYFRFASVKPTTVALTYLVSIQLIATAWGIAEASVASFSAFACFNFFFLPPVGKWTVADPGDWVALFAFLVTAIMASQLSSRARRRIINAMTRQNDMERLYALSRALLLSDGGAATATDIARHIADTFDLSAVALYDHSTGSVSRAGPDHLAGIESTLREVIGQPVPRHNSNDAVVMIIRLGGEPIGSLAILGAGLTDTVLQSISNLAAIGLERARGREATARAEAARQSGELRATVLDAVAHEFKTPLTSIKAAASDLISTVPTGTRERELVEIVGEESNRLQALITDAVQMLRIEAGGFTVRRERHSLAKLVASSISELRSRLNGHHVTNQVPAETTIDADGDLLRLALRQLLDNAAKHSPPASTIEVAAYAGLRVDIVVRNSGSAIPEREQTHIFDRFYRGSHARRTPGTGMGLAIVRQIAEAHGGAVTVSSAQGTGTEFMLSWPRGEDVL